MMSVLRTVLLGLDILGGIPLGLDLSFPSAYIYCKTQIMKKSIAVKPKRGRPATGRDPFVGIRLPATLIEDIRTWADKQGAESRSEAIRRLVEIALKSETPSKPIARRPGRRSRAQDLAKDAIDHMADPGASPGEHAERRRRLTKGPPEFREDRVDLPKAKNMSAGIIKYFERDGYGRKLNRVLFALSGNELPNPADGADWRLDPTFDRGTEIFNAPQLKEVFERVLRNGYEIVRLPGGSS
jgi:hypothetical protein